MARLDRLITMGCGHEIAVVFDRPASPAERVTYKLQGLEVFQEPVMEGQIDDLCRAHGRTCSRQGLAPPLAPPR